MWSKNNNLTFVKATENRVCSYIKARGFLSDAGYLVENYQNTVVKLKHMKIQSIKNQAQVLKTKQRGNYKVREFWAARVVGACGKCFEVFLRLIQLKFPSDVLLNIQVPGRVEPFLYYFMHLPFR